MKICTGCKKERSLAEYYHDRGYIRPKCKECVKAARKIYYKENRDKSLESVKRYNESKKGKLKRKAYAKKRAKTIKFKEANREWSLTEKGKAGRRRRVNRYSKTDNGIAAHKRKRFKQRAAKDIPNSLTATEWNDILIFHNYSCAYCKKPFTVDLPATQDHVIPVSKGGTHTKGNVVPCCRECNSSKGDGKWPKSLLKQTKSHQT